MMNKLVSSLLLVACLGLACSDSDDSSGGANNTAGSGGSAGQAGMAGASGEAGAAGSSGSSGQAGAAGSATATLKAPKLDMVMPMEGALHVMWINQQPDCDTVEGERKTDTEPYAVVFTVPGEADNKHDTTATMDMTYTYRLRCKKGDASSDYSNEVSGNPTK